jgi:hypothetical protein
VLFVPIVVPTAVATGKYSHDHGYGPYTLSCADAPLRDAAGNLNRDNILSPTDMARLDLQLNVMNGIIRLEAARRGFAYFQLGALYDDVVVKAPFDAVALMTSDEPYGPYISLDGIHPSAKGHEVLAQAALNALARRYDLEGRHAPLLVASQE